MTDDLRKMTEEAARKWHLQDWLETDEEYDDSIQDIADVIEQVARKWGEETAYQAAICTLGGMDDQIAKLEKRVAELEGALRPLAEVIEGIPLERDDINRARRVLRKGEKDG